MSSLSTSLDIAGTGIRAVNAELALVAHNIANANTPGYVAEQIGQDSLTAAGQGEGVLTGVATRSLDLQLQQDTFAQNGAVSALATTQTALQSVDAAQGTVAGGNDLSSMLAALKSAFTSLGSDPSSQVQQAQVVNAAQSLASKINSLGESYTTTRQSVQDDLVANVGALNTALGTVGTLTDQIMFGKANNQSTADLENQRDAALQSVSSLVGVKYLAQANGDVVVTTAGGLTLPIHSTDPLSLAGSVVGPGSARQLGNVPGVTINGQDVTLQLTGGSIGAEVTLRDTTLPTYMGELDQFAQTMTTRFSEQGLTLFTGATGAIPVATGTPAQGGFIGYSLSVQVNPAVVANPALVRDGTDTIAGSAGGASAFTPNGSATQTGFATMINRVLDFTFGASIQPGVAQAAIPVAGLGPSGSLNAPYGTLTTLSGAASALVGSQAQDMSNTASALATEQAVQSTLQAKFSATSAVNTDTELANMVKLQSSYGANAKIFTAVEAMWTQLLATVA